ncbi:MAG: hypothetical protein JRC89_14775, partial [Deltaproteobacteria bacterium]|nr:hypothetical protein [Deltaproteobacteria bacterium]
SINKKYVVDKHGNPKEVIILFEDFKKIEELLGLDLNEKIKTSLRRLEENPLDYPKIKNMTGEWTGYKR